MVRRLNRRIRRYVNSLTAGLCAGGRRRFLVGPAAGTGWPAWHRVGWLVGGCACPRRRPPHLRRQAAVSLLMRSAPARLTYHPRESHLQVTRGMRATPPGRGAHLSRAPSHRGGVDHTLCCWARLCARARGCAASRCNAPPHPARQRDASSSACTTKWCVERPCRCMVARAHARDGQPLPGAPRRRGCSVCPVPRRARHTDPATTFRNILSSARVDFGLAILTVVGRGVCVCVPGWPPRCV